MREIKFRGRRIDNGEWVYGDLLRVSGFGTKHTEIYRDDVDEQHPPEIDPETVGQFTGLRDKNGVEIYEGDLLLDDGEIMWSDDDCGFINNYEGIEAQELTMMSDWAEVIGNIHEEGSGEAL